MGSFLGPKTPYLTLILRRNLPFHLLGWGVYTKRLPFFVYYYRYRGVKGLGVIVVREGHPTLMLENPGWRSKLGWATCQETVNYGITGTTPGTIKSLFSSLSLTGGDACGLLDT